MSSVEFSPKYSFSVLLQVGSLFTSVFRSWVAMWVILVPGSRVLPPCSTGVSGPTFSKAESLGFSTSKVALCAADPVSRVPPQLACPALPRRPGGSGHSAWAVPSGREAASSLRPDLGGCAGGGGIFVEAPERGRSLGSSFLPSVGCAFPLPLDIHGFFSRVQPFLHAGVQPAGTGSGVLLTWCWFSLLVFCWGVWVSVSTGLSAVALFRRRFWF